MTGIGLLARVRRSRWERLIIALVAVPAILVGLLAMHVLTTGGMSAPGETQSMTTHQVVDISFDNHDGVPAAEGSGMPAMLANCTEQCGASHEMLGMICILGLLVGTILLILQLTLIPWADVKRAGLALAAKANALAPPSPPSLFILSISRR